MIVLTLLLSIAAAKDLPKNQLIKPCALCWIQYRECRKAAVDSSEYSIEIEECQDTHYSCFHKNKCYLEGSR